MAAPALLRLGHDVLQDGAGARIADQEATCRADADLGTGHDQERAVGPAASPLSGGLCCKTSIETTQER